LDRLASAEPLQAIDAAIDPKSRCAPWSSRIGCGAPL